MANKIFNTNLDISGDVKSNSYKFNLPSSLPGQVNTLMPKIDGTRPIWFDNSSVANDLAFKSDIDNLQIGGRNLLRNSSNFTTPFFSGTVLETKDGHITCKGTGGGAFYGSTIPTKSDTYYTFSAEIMFDSAVNVSSEFPLHHQFIDASGGLHTEVESKLISPTTIPANTWGRIIITVKTSSLGNQRFVPFIYNLPAGVTFWVKNIQLEQGNKPTDYTPAPEDKQDNLQTIVGNVGIGTTSPQAKLDVNGGIISSNKNYFHNQFGFQPTISVAIGDYDTGFNWEGDGVISYYSNGVKQFNLNNVWHSGNFSQTNLNSWNSVAQNYLGYVDDRIISPNYLGTKKIQFGFTSFTNNNTGPWADFIHFGGYQDSSGGNQNLIVFNKTNFGIRQYQGTFQSGTSYSNYVDYWHSRNFNPNNYVTLDTDQTIMGQKSFLHPIKLYDMPNGGYSTISISDSSFQVTEYNGDPLFNVEIGYISLGSLGAFTISGNTAFRSYTFPNKAGTVALTDDLTNFVTLNTNQTITGTKTFDSIIYFNNNVGGIQGTMGDNDHWRIKGAANSWNLGYLELATADDGTEPIIVSQYFGEFSNLARKAYLLDESGNTSFPGTVTAPTFSGNLNGNAATATNSTNALRITFDDGPRNLSDRLPNSFVRTVNFDFVTSGIVGGAGNFAGVMTFSPWDGTTNSTGDSSYQLAFLNETGINGTGLPGLVLRKGIDSTWGSWYNIAHSGNLSITYSGNTLSLLVKGNVISTATINARSSYSYTAGTNISISGNQISVVSSPTFAGSVTATAFYESSLRKLKENILPFELSGLGLISQLEIVTYDRKDGSVKDKIGIIADDSPEEFLSENKDSVDLYKTVFIQAKAIQELNAKNLELENTVNCLEDQIQNLRELITLKLTK